MVLEGSELVAIVLAFLLAGILKGVVGLGLAPAALGLSALFVEMTTAMVLLSIPSLLTNFWQAAGGGNSRTIVRRVWPFLLMAAGAVSIGAMALTRLDGGQLSTLLGASLVAYGALNLSGVRLSIPAHREAWMGPILGSANGLITGMTGSFVGPGVMYLQAIGLPRDMLVQAMGMLFVVSTVALSAALYSHEFFTVGLLLASAVTVVPTLAGVSIGRVVRARTPEAHFRTLFFVILCALGVYIVLSNLPARL